MKYRKIQTGIEAVQFIGCAMGQVQFNERPQWLAEKLKKGILSFDKAGTLTIKTLAGDLIANNGDYIIQGVNGELYPCKPDIFVNNYDRSSWKLKIMLLKDLTPIRKKGAILEANIWWDHEDNSKPLHYYNSEGTIPLSAAVKIECGTCKHMNFKTDCRTLKDCDEKYSLWECSPTIEKWGTEGYKHKKDCPTCKHTTPNGLCNIIGCTAPWLDRDYAIPSMWEAKEEPETSSFGRALSTAATGIVRGNNVECRDCGNKVSCSHLPPKSHCFAWVSAKPGAALNDPVNHPIHYCDGGIEVIDYIDAKDFNYHLGNVIKYVSRAGKKGSTVEDLKKARWYLDREIKILGAKK